MADANVQKVVTIVGARPQFIKAATVSRAVARWNAAHPDAAIRELIVHTGQHYDPSMSQVFFDELAIPEPFVNLKVGSAPHGRQTGLMLDRIEQVLIDQSPDVVVVYGDTNSTLAGALAAAKLHIPLAHVEAGLRCHDRRRPEEVNRVVSDHLSTLLFCPTDRSVDNLRAEGITEGVHQVGDVMYDSVLFNRERARERSDIVSRLGLTPGAYCLATVHRAENTDVPERMAAILAALRQLDRPLVMPLHPRTRKVLGDGLAGLLDRAIVIDPVPYLDMLALESSASMVLADSGGVQKEAFFFRVPCITLSDVTEWVELVETGWNQLAGADTGRILAAVSDARPGRDVSPYGDGRAAEHVVDLVRKTA